MTSPPLAADGPEAPGPADLTAPATLRRAVWGVADQGVYSLSNFALAILIASSAGAIGFGAFAAVAAVYTLCLGVAEALTSEVFTVVHSTTDRTAVGTPLAEAAGCALGLGAALSLLALACSWPMGGELSSVLTAFALIIPALFLQDLWRFAFFALGRPQAALLNDVLWGIVQAVSLTAVKVFGAATVPELILAWGAGGFAGALLGLLQGRVMPRPLRTWSWLARHRALGLRFAGEWLTLYGATQIVLVFVGATSGLAELAGLRAAQIIFGPLQGLLNGVRLSITSLAIRVRERRPARLSSFTLWITLGLGFIATLWSVAAFFLPASLGRALFGASWNGAREVLPAVTTHQVAAGLSLGALTALRATRAARRSFRARTTIAALGVTFGIFGAVIGEARGAAIGVATASVVGLVLLAWQARAAIGDDTARLARIPASDRVAPLQR